MQLALKRKVFFILVVLFCWSGLQAQNRVQHAIDALKSDPAFRHASWGVCVIRTSDARVIGEYNAEQVLVPASAMKIATTFPAWSMLGKDFRFKTLLEYDGIIHDEGILEGSIYIKGDGDPALGSDRFKETAPDKILDRWAAAINRRGIREVKGSIIADASIYNGQMIPPDWIWGDIGNYYGAGCSGLNFHENYYNVIFKPGQNVNENAKILRIEPPLQGMEIDNRVTTGPAGSGDKVVIYGSPNSVVRLMEGTVPVDSSEFRVKGSMPDPALFTAQYFSDHLAKNDITVDHAATTISLLQKNGNHISSTWTCLDTCKSPALGEIIRETHYKSVNTFCEALLMKVGQMKGKGGNTESGIAVIRKFWQDKGLDISGMEMKDASGLSPLNRFSPRQLAGMMQIIAREDSNREFTGTLNLAGRSGDLKNLFIGSAAENRLRAKSGFMTNVRAYTGIVKNTKGEELAFCIIVNHYEGSTAGLKSRLEKLMILFAGPDE
jgi:serine-type D-Ala-D-Ala carboxypeptidase/endopeptidase (penicillin-binding protein 4)